MKTGASSTGNAKQKNLQIKDPSQTTQNFGVTSPLSKGTDKNSMSQSNFFLRQSVSNFSPRITPSSKGKFPKFYSVSANSIQQLQENEKRLEEQYKKNMEISFELFVEDKQPKDLIGEKAIDVYYKHYKHLDKIKEKNRLPDTLTEDSPYTAILAKSEEISVLPSKLGIIKMDGDQNCIDIRNFKYGDGYCQVLSEGVKLLPNIQQFNLSGNRITTKGADTLLGSLSKSVKSLDLSSNAIGRLGIDHLYKILNRREYRIEELNLEDNKLGDRNVIYLSEALSQNNSLRKLNLSKNFLTNICGEALKEVLQKNDSLLELYLHWNQIKSGGGISIFQGLIDNEAIRVFDMSWNSLGNGTPSVVPFILETFKTNEKLVHLDLSSNHFTQEESKKIAEGLENNHTIYGFHFKGNYGFVDTRGFLVIPENIPKDVNDLHINNRIQSCSLLKTYHPRKQDEESKDCCWICEGWQEQEFFWVPGESGDAYEEPIFIHLDFENYFGVWMGKMDSKKQFSYKRIIPPGRTTFFFTANEMQTPNKKYPEATFEHDSLIKNVKLGKRNLNVHVETRNVINWPRKPDLVGRSYVATILTKPRTRDPKYIPPKKLKEKRKWSFPISIFKDYKKDDEELLKKCFETDWACSRIPRIIKKEDDIAAVKEIWRGRYKQYKECYKYFSSSNPVGDIWAISQNPFTDFITQCDIIDQKNVKLSDVDLKFIATLSAAQELKNNPRNPDRALIRFQLMECITRLAEDKFMKPGVCTTYAEAVSNKNFLSFSFLSTAVIEIFLIITKALMLKDHCDKIFNQFNSQKWRDERYWNEECDDVLKLYKPVLENVYLKYSVKKKKPGEKNFMCLDELSDICKHCNLYDENFVERDMQISFNLGMMTQWDELNQDRIFKMQFVEFLEAFARIAEKLSPCPLGGNPIDWPYERRSKLHLGYKLEALIVIMLKTIADSYLQESITVPALSMFDKTKVDEYEDIEY